MTRSRLSGLGGQGEDMAASYLKNKGYSILARNYRLKFGELDIISKNTQNVLVFVEVKTLSRNSDSSKSLLPEDNLSSSKLHKLKRICRFFANAHPELVGEYGWRIDLIAITFSPEGRFAKHYKNL